MRSSRMPQSRLPQVFNVQGAPSAKGALRAAAMAAVGQDVMMGVPTQGKKYTAEFAPSQSSQSFQPSQPTSQTDSSFASTTTGIKNVIEIGKYVIGIIIILFIVYLIYRAYKWWTNLDILGSVAGAATGALKAVDVANLGGSKPLSPDGIPRVCEDGKSLDAGLCYKSCPGGDAYKRVGPVCWQKCPSNFTDTGVSCLKPKPYGRGAGYPWKFGDKAFSLDGARARCAAANPQGCEKNGEIIYPKCKSGFHNVGCCICSPDCPSGMTDAGISCTKKTQPIGAGTIPTLCPTDRIKVGALCYKPCDTGYYRDLLLCKKCDNLKTEDKAAKGCPVTTKEYFANKISKALKF